MKPKRGGESKIGKKIEKAKGNGENGIEKKLRNSLKIIEKEILNHIG